MAQEKYGIYAVNLGAPCLQVPVSEDDGQWKGALKIDPFFLAGGNPRLVTSTSVLMKWTMDQLCLLFRNVDEPGNADQRRSDSNEIVLSSGNFGHRDFSVFKVSREGEKRAYKEIGMTYIGGDVAMTEAGMATIDEGEITEIDNSQYQCVISRSENMWTSMFIIPWSLFGGFPREYFYFQLYRRKSQTSEVTTPAPLDMHIHLPYWQEYDPSTLIEAALDGERKVLRADQPLIILPSGIKRWVRPGKILPPGEGELEKMNRQLAELTAVTEKNLAESILLAQRLQDILSLEGADFFWDEARSRPFEHREPWLERRMFNEENVNGDIAESYKRVEDYLCWLREYVKWWYTDGTLGEQTAQWAPFKNLKNVFVHKEEKEIALAFESGKELILAFSGNGLRVRYNKMGFFDREASAFASNSESDVISFISGDDTVKITKGAQWCIRYTKAASIKEIMINMDTFRVLEAEDGEGFDFRMPLSEDEPVYGFGERFDHINQRGNVLALYQRDAYLSVLAGLANEAYKNIPLVHFGTGYSVFVNSTYRGRADVGRDKSNELRISIADPGFDMWFWIEQPAQIMQNYAKLTGMPILPPRWVFEPWAGGGGGRWMNGPLHNVVEEQMGVIEKFKELDIPHSGLYAEGAGSGFVNSDIGAPYVISSFAKANGIHTFSWQFSVMPKEQAIELLGDDRELPLMEIACNENNRPYTSYIDFTHPRAAELVRAQWAHRFAAGIRGTMVDFGDLIPDEAKFYDGRGGKEMHNGYGYEYAKIYRQVFEEKYGDDHVLFQRCATAGTQAFTCQFGGDQATSFFGMINSIRGGLTAAASGLPFWGVDATGYDGPMTDDEAYIRWTQYACFCPIMRYHGTTPREPWEHTDEAVTIYKYFAWLRENLLDYSYSTAIQAHHTGIPMMRVLPMVFPDDKGIWRIEDEYMYGDHLLVAPVYSENPEKKIIFPKGDWVSFFNNREQIHNERSFTKTVPLEEIPLYIRSGAVIPMCLNGSLQPGMSMTTSKEKVLLITKPYGDVSGSWNGSDTEENNYSFIISESGFTFAAKGTIEYKYILLKGMTGKVSDIFINGRVLANVPAKQGLISREAWYQMKDGTIAIHLLSHSELNLTVREV